MLRQKLNHISSRDVILLLPFLDFFFHSTINIIKIKVNAILPESAQFHIAGEIT